MSVGWTHSTIQIFLARTSIILNSLCDCIYVHMFKDYVQSILRTRNETNNDGD